MGHRIDAENKFEYNCENKLFREDLHCHNRIEIIRVKTGSARLRTDMGSVVYDVYCGDCAVIAGTDIHRIFTSEKQTVEYIHFPVSCLNLFSPYIKSSFVIPKEEIEAENGAAETVNGIFTLVSSPDIAESTAVSLVSCLCSLLLSLYPKRRTVKTLGDDSTGNVNRGGSVSIETMERFDKALDYIKENFTHSEINLGLISKVSGLGSTFLSALFPKLTGRTFKNYVHRLRINKAVELLTTTEKNISETAIACGFDTIRSFNNVFKSICGTTPTGFLSAVSGKDNGGINTEVSGTGQALLNLPWTSNVMFHKNRAENFISVESTETSLKLWCHFKIRMLFFAGKTYEISFKTRQKSNTAGETPQSNHILCNFYFHDSYSNIEHHLGNRISITELSDGWWLHRYIYTVPDFYVPRADDNFSVYSEPYRDLAVNFDIKDVTVTFSKQAEGTEHPDTKQGVHHEQ